MPGGHRNARSRMRGRSFASHTGGAGRRRDAAKKTAEQPHAKEFSAAAKFLRNNPPRSPAPGARTKSFAKQPQSLGRTFRKAAISGPRRRAAKFRKTTPCSAVSSEIGGPSQGSASRAAY